nr:immunoglobulin light chain junction region [Macaca mulatta]MPN65815.1 immunoglobulin light chain junction region [Macaca mulatta]MPN65887.1 immunoglobulin light chain junction region [Macaca mulatta]MPN66032.1 immunoglobulin light chain junction region [Macaca mulatta]MPN66134.1 immunoglobulin light chain junction region [Macaca mulatta]
CSAWDSGLSTLF